MVLNVPSPKTATKICFFGKKFQERGKMEKNIN